MTYIFYKCKYLTQYYIYTRITYVHLTHVLKIYISIYICAMCIYVYVFTYVYTVQIFAYKHIHHIIMIFLSHFFTEVLLIPNTMKNNSSQGTVFLKPLQWAGWRRYPWGPQNQMPFSRFPLHLGRWSSIQLPDVILWPTTFSMFTLRVETVQAIFGNYWLQTQMVFPLLFSLKTWISASSPSWRLD